MCLRDVLGKPISSRRSALRQVSRGSPRWLSRKGRGRARDGAAELSRVDARRGERLDVADEPAFDVTLRGFEVELQGEDVVAPAERMVAGQRRRGQVGRAGGDGEPAVVPVRHGHFAQWREDGLLGEVSGLYPISVA